MQLSDVRALLDTIREDFAANGRDWTAPGFRALVMYRFGAWRMGIANPVLRMPCSVLYRAMHRYVRNHYGIELHYTATLGHRVRIAHQSAIVLEENVTIGDDCLIRHGVTVGLASGTARREGSAVIGNRVQLGVGAVVVGPVRIGDDAVIAPNAVVTSDVPAGAIATGPPARVIPSGSTKEAVQA